MAEEIKMAIRFATVLVAVFATVNSQPRPIYATSGTTLGEKPDHINTHYVSEENPTYINRPYTNCAFEGQGYNVHEMQGKENFNKIPMLRWENPRFIEERLLFPFGSLRPKKAQKAILLDVGDYVIKSNGSPGEAGAPQRASGGGIGAMGGILRSSG